MGPDAAIVADVRDAGPRDTPAPPVDVLDDRRDGIDALDVPDVRADEGPETFDVPDVTVSDIPDVPVVTDVFDAETDVRDVAPDRAIDVPVDIPIPVLPIDFAAGYYHTCARRVDGTVACWGYNGLGQLGLGTAGGTRSTPTNVPMLGGVTQLTGGTYHTCARAVDGSAYCWGRNDAGQLGNGGLSEYRASPVRVVGIAGVVQLAGDWAHTCALTTAGSVWCWGRNLHGELGSLGYGEFRTSPVVSLDRTDVVQVESGARHNCARLRSGRVTCWGWNEYGQLGVGIASMSALPPTEVPGITEATHIAVGAYFSCAVIRSSTVVCWGLNNEGQIGTGSVGGPRTSPTPVAGISNASQVSAGERHSCALLADGALQCWGANDYGQLGDGTTATARAAPVTVLGLRNVVHVSAGYSHSCASLADRRVHCWGDNAWSQIGDGTGEGPRLTPVAVSGF